MTLTPDAATDLILDTGSVTTQVPLANLEALHPTATAYSTGIEQIGALYICPTLRLPRLNLGNLWVPDVVVGTLPSETTSLGMEILAGYHLTLSGPNAQLTLEPSATGGRYVQGWSGFDLKQTGEDWSVRKLKAGSPARQAGMRVGDEVLKVNGRSIQGLSRLQVRRLTSGLFGRPQRVSLRRGRGKTPPGKTFDVSWVPLDQFTAPRGALDGLTLKKPGGLWIVVNMLKGCPGDEMGLQAGDEIPRMDGALVADMPLNSLVTLMDQASESITLSVMRAGRAEPLSVKLSAPPP